MLRPHSPYYNKTIRSYVVAFGNLFNEISVQQFAVDGNPTKTIRVPIAFTKKERYIQRIEQGQPIEGDVDRTIVQMTLPRMGFELVDLSYDPERKLNTVNRRARINPADGDNNSAISMFQCVPWNFQFQLYITTKKIDEMLQIVEQILPFFRPHFMLNIKDNQNFVDTIDVPLVFSGVSMEDRWEGDMRDEERRIIMWTLTFTLKGNLYSPVQTTPLIKQTETSFKNYNCEPSQTTIIKPDPFDAGPDTAYGFDIEVIDYDG